MESPNSSISSLSASEATRLLKDLLNVGKQNLVPSNDLSQSNDGSSASANASSTNGDHQVAEGGDGILSSVSSSSSKMMQDGLSQGIIRQQILLEGEDEQNNFNMYGRDVDVILSAASDMNHATAASNKVKTSTVVKYEWENNYYYGHLVAVHRDGVHMAYALKGKSGGIVRLINCRTAVRSLVKGFQGKVMDLSFAHLSAVILGAVDQVGNLFVYEIQEDNKGDIEPVLLLQVDRPEGTPESEFHRLIWCPYIPEEDESSGVNTTADSSVTDDAGKLLVLTHGEMAEMWNVDTVTNGYGSGPLQPEEVEQGYLKITSHAKPIVDASFSPDGTAIATASLDGHVKFFQVYMQDRAQPTCLHQWKPHDGKPVTSLFFLDDHKHPNPEVQFWKYAITGADNNQELKVWSCETWTCLQTIRFLAPPGPQSLQPSIKASIDLSSNYLLLSDINRKVLYLMNIHQDSETGKARFTSISEFLLTHPCLSLVIVNAGRHRFKKGMTDSTDIGGMTTGEIDNDDEEEVPREANGPDIAVRIKVYSVHTRALQELRIRYQEEDSLSRLPPLSHTSSSTGDALRDGLSDVTLDTTGASEGDRICLASSASGDASSDSSHSKSKDLLVDYGVNDKQPRSAALNHETESRLRREDTVLLTDRSDISASLNHEAEARLRREDTVLLTDRSDLSELSFRSNNRDDQPVLQTPDDFASPRKQRIKRGLVIKHQGKIKKVKKDPKSKEDYPESKENYPESKENVLPDVSVKEMIDQAQVESNTTTEKIIDAEPNRRIKVVMYNPDTREETHHFAEIVERPGKRNIITVLQEVIEKKERIEEAVWEDLERTHISFIETDEEECTRISTKEGRVPEKTLSGENGEGERQREKFPTSVPPKLETIEVEEVPFFENDPEWKEIVLMDVIYGTSKEMEDKTGKDFGRGFQDIISRNCEDIVAEERRTAFVKDGAGMEDEIGKRLIDLRAREPEGIAAVVDSHGSGEPNYLLVPNEVELEMDGVLGDSVGLVKSESQDSRAENSSHLSDLTFLHDNNREVRELGEQIVKRTTAMHQYIQQHRLSQNSGSARDNDSEKITNCAWNFLNVLGRIHPHGIGFNEDCALCEEGRGQISYLMSLTDPSLSRAFNQS